MADETFTKADLDKAVKDAIEEATKGLKDNLTAALDEAKEAKRKLRAASEIKPEDVAALEAELDKAKTDLAAAQKAAKDNATAAEKATKALETEQSFTHKLVAENGVVEQLTKAGVTDPAYLEAAKALHLSNVKVVNEGDARVAMYGDKPLADAIKEWAGGDVGKKFVAAPANSGGGSNGGGKGEAGKTMLRSQFDALPQADRASFSKEGGKVVDQAA